MHLWFKRDARVVKLSISHVFTALTFTAVEIDLATRSAKL